MKTHADLEALKANWVRDPIWDIETTEGFEEHREELAAFAAAKKKQWAAKELARRERLEYSNALAVTLRDQIAVAAMNGMLAYSGNNELATGSVASVARIAYELADAMLLERMKDM